MKLILISAIVFVLQCTLMPRIALADAQPDILFALALSYALCIERPALAIASCWTVGLLKDIGSGGLMGIFALIFLIVGYAVNRLKVNLFKESLLVQLALTFGMALLCQLIYAGVTAMTVSMPPFAGVVGKSFAIACYTAPATPLFILLLMKTVFTERTLTETPIVLGRRKIG